MVDTGRPPALGWMIAAAVVTAYRSNYEKQHRTILMQLFGQYVSPVVAETIWQQRDQLLRSGVAHAHNDWLRACCSPI